MYGCAVDRRCQACVCKSQTLSCMRVRMCMHVECNNVSCFIMQTHSLTVPNPHHDISMRKETPQVKHACISVQTSSTGHSMMQQGGLIDKGNFG